MISDQAEELPSKYKSTKTILEEIWKKAEEEKAVKAKERAAVNSNGENDLQSSGSIDDNIIIVKTAADTSNKETKNQNFDFAKSKF